MVTLSVLKKFSLKDAWVLLLTPRVAYAGKHSKIYQCSFPHPINHLNRADHMADKTLEMWRRHAKSQVAWNQDRSRTPLFPLFLSHRISPSYFTRHFLVHLITSLSLVIYFFFHFPPRRKREAIPVCKGLGVDNSLSLLLLSLPPSLTLTSTTSPPSPLSPSLCREGPGRCTDWWERMIYVASVSRLSSGPLSLIIAISFSHCSLVCAPLWKKQPFLSPVPHQESPLMLLPRRRTAATIVTYEMDITSKACDSSPSRGREMREELLSGCEVEWIVDIDFGRYTLCSV